MKRRTSGIRIIWRENMRITKKKRGAMGKLRKEVNSRGARYREGRKEREGRT